MCKLGENYIMKKILLIIFIGISFSSKGQFSDTLNFENDSTSLIIVDSITGCWQIGTPSKVLFDSAYSAPFAAVTDTLNYYSDNCYESAIYLTIPIINFSYGWEFRFLHKYDFEVNIDGGSLEYFNCFSTTWETVTTQFWSPADCNGMVVPWWSSLDNNMQPIMNGKKGFTGTSNGWQEDTVYFQCVGVMDGIDTIRGAQQEIKLRFIVYSDSINTNQEGWMIDNIVFNDWGGNCPGNVNENYLYNKIDVFPNPAKNQITFETSGSKKMNEISILDFSGRKILTQSFSGKNKYTMDVSSLSEGMYFYFIQTESNNYFTGKFIKE